MGKRIRHLEFYGYADQNAYIGLPNADLSDIREVNKEQDKEINAISGATKDKADLSTVNELSGKVDTFIDKQDLINKWLAKGINKNRERIDGLERRDEEITNKINEIVDDFNPIYDELGRISRKTDELDTKLTEHIAESEEFENRINNKVDGLEDGLEGKLDKTEAYDTFAKKADVYTKREVDELIEDKTQDYATEQWVMSRGFIKETDADGKYASKARLNALEDRVGDIQTTLYNQYNELNSDLSQYKTVTNGRIETLYNRVGTLETKCDREIANLQEDIAELTEDVIKNTNDIYQINNVALPSKADKADLNTLESRVNNLSDSLNNKVDKTDYERDKARFGVQLDSLDDRKADRTELRAVSGAVDNLADALEQEKRDRIAGDNALGQRIDDTNGRIDDIREENIERDEKISNLRRDLNKEINDRVEADNAIIGSASDREEDNTIYGAKKYAKNVANNALNEAKAYTDVKDSAVRDYVDETKADLERQITAKADKSYVNAVKAEIEASIDDKVEEETLRAVNKENIISTALTHTSNIVKALTDWDGDDRADYTDIGNGIIDVMHRELHGLNIAAATKLFADAVYYKHDNKIHFKNQEGSEICSINVSEFTLAVIERTWVSGGIIYIEFANGDIVEIDAGQIIDEGMFEDGLQVIDGKVSVKKDPTSEDYLSVSSNGVKVSGIDAKIETITSGVSEEIAAERERATSAEEELEDKIAQLRQELNGETARATSAETEIKANVVELDDKIAALRQSLNEEIERATAKEEELEGADIVSGNIASDATISITKNNGDIITFASAEQVDLEAGEF